MSDKSKTDLFVEHVNSHILPFIDYSALQASYDSDMVYAKGILNRLHEAMVTAYGSERLSETDGENGFVVIPGVVCGRESGKTCLALLELDLSSSGEHWGTSYLCKYGVISQDGAANNSVLKSEIKEINAAYIPYDYGYTATIPGDIHVDRASLPDGIKSILDDFKNHRAALQSEDKQLQGEYYGIWAVRGGGSVLGAAEAWSKRDGVPEVFTSKAEAQAQAERYNKSTASVNVRYYVKEMEPELAKSALRDMEKAAAAQKRAEMTEKYNYLAAAEMSAEQNYNMIDGAINNLPSPRADLTDGQTYEEIRELAPETLPCEKPSVTEKLEAAKRAVKDAPKKQPREKKPSELERG